MSSDRLFIRCRCGREPQMLAKIWGGRTGGDTEFWPGATDNLEKFFDDHAGCAVEGFSLCFELEAAGLAEESSQSDAPEDPDEALGPVANEVRKIIREAYDPYARAEVASEARLPDRDGRVEGVDR